MEYSQVLTQESSILELETGSQKSLDCKMNFGKNKKMSKLYELENDVTLMF